MLKDRNLQYWISTCFATVQVLFKGNKLLTEINFTVQKSSPHGEISTVEKIQRQGRVVQYVDKGREHSRSLMEPQKQMAH